MIIRILLACVRLNVVSTLLIKLGIMVPRWRGWLRRMEVTGFRAEHEMYLPIERSQLDTRHGNGNGVEAWNDS